MNNHELPLVLMTHTLPDEWVASLKGKCRLMTGPVDATHFSQDLLGHIEETAGLFTLLTIPIKQTLLEGAGQLRVISNMAAGVDNIDIVTCTRLGIPVGNTPGVLTEGTADLTMALLLALARRIPQAREDALTGKWKTWSPTGWLGADLCGAILGIVGMGKIGKAVARRAKCFGMHIVYFDPVQIEEITGTYLTLEELFRQSDFISLHMPLSQSTFHVINAQLLSMVKPSAYLINTSRGSVIDQQALVYALMEGQLAGAALDVTDPEPLPLDHPLFQLPNCLIVPHIGSATQKTRRRMAELACENLLAGLEGRPLTHCVNPEVYQKR